MDLTKPQISVLSTAFRKGSVPGHVRPRRLVVRDRLVSEGLLSPDLGNGITVKGLVVLHRYHQRRWGRVGCMAYLQDLQEVEKALAAVPALAARQRKKLGYA